MNQSTIAQSIQQFAFQGVANQQKTAEQALADATSTVDNMLSQANALAVKYNGNIDIVFQSIQQFAFQGIGQGKTPTQAVSDAVTTVVNMLSQAATLAAKYATAAGTPAT
jgi:hypothetical protein